MNFGGNGGGGSSSFAAPSFGDKLRMGFSQLQDSVKDIGEQFTLAKECERAARIISEFVVPPKIGDIDDIIPADVLQRCHGIAVMSIIKAGFIWSGRVGTGLVCARLPDGTWSGPSAITTGGMGIGGQIGAQLTEVVMILNDEAAVHAFEENASLQLGSNVSVAAGPLGRSGELAAAVNTSNVAGVYSYSRSKGLFAGVSFEGSVIAQRRDVNRDFYGRAAPPELVLNGEIAPPQGVSEWEVLRAVLQDRCTPHPQPYAAADYRQPSPYVATHARETLYDEDAARMSPNTAAASALAGAPAAGAPGALPPRGTHGG